MKGQARKRMGILCCTMISIGVLAGCGEKPSTSTEATSVEVAPAEDSSTSTTQAKIPSYEGYELLWNDEFDGTEVNTDIWNYELHEPGWVNQELQEYTDSKDNVYLEDGNLIIKAIKTTDDTGSTSYTSGRMTTQNKQDFLYGKVVIRAKVPEGQGLWPALWMMPTDENLYGQWPKCGEIDIMEVLGHQVNTAYGTVHCGEPYKQQQGSVVLDEGTFASDYHEFSVEWEPGEMRFYIDGILYHTVNDWFTAVEGEAEKPYPAPFNQNFYLILNMAVGGTWPGNPDETTNFDNAELAVDYVRVYQKPEYDTNVTKPVKEVRTLAAGESYLANGDFSESMDTSDAWTFLLAQNGAGSAEIKDGMMVISTQDDGDVDYSVQLVQGNLPLEKGGNYQVSFEAKASDARDMIVCVSAPDNGWIRYLADTKVSLTTDWQTYSYNFVMEGSNDPNGRFEFNMGNQNSIGEINIKNVVFEKID